ncbi:hypothetical protein [Desulfonauticus submarinus]
MADVYIIYSSKDSKSDFLTLKKALQEDGYIISEEDIFEGSEIDNYMSTIENIQNMRWVLIICSSSTIESVWVNEYHRISLELEKNIQISYIDSYFPTYFIYKKNHINNFFPKFFPKFFSLFDKRITSLKISLQGWNGNKNIEYKKLLKKIRKMKLPMNFLFLFLFLFFIKYYIVPHEKLLPFDLDFLDYDKNLSLLDKILLKLFH